MPFPFENLLLPFLWSRRGSIGAKGKRRTALFVSVGHTAHSQVNSGIQRVTRSIAKEVLAKYEDSDMLEWFLEKNRFILLDEVARERFSRFSGPPHEKVDVLLKREHESLLSVLSEGDGSSWEQLYESISPDEAQIKSLNGASWKDRFKLGLIRKLMRKCYLRLQELEREEESNRIVSAKRIRDQIVSIRSEIGNLHEALGEEVGSCPTATNTSERNFEFRSCAEEAMLSPLLAEPFAGWALVRTQTEELTEYFENLVGEQNRGGFRALQWVSYLPIPRVLRRELRRCIRKFDNARIQSADRRLIRGFIAKVVKVRLAIDHFRSRHQRLLDLKSDWEWYRLMCLIEGQRMLEDSLGAERFEGIKKRLERIVRIRRRLYPRKFLPAPGSWVLIPELMTSKELENVLSFARKHALKVAVVFHDALPVQFPDLVSKRYREDHERYMHTIANADFLLPVSEYSKTCYLDWAKDMGVDVPQIEVCLNGVQFRDKAKELNGRALPEKVQGDFALCVSTVEPRKNHLKLLEAWIRLVEKEESLPQLVLVGNRYSGFEDLAELVSQVCKEEEGVVWLEGVSDEDLETLYARCRFTVFPSIAEGFGLPILESLWYGSPCLCANFGAMEEVARDGGCVRVDMRDVDAIERGIRSMVYDESLMASLKEECARRKMRTWSDYATQVGQILGLEATEKV